MTQKNEYFDVIFQSYFRESDFGQNGNKYLEFRSKYFQQMDGFQSQIFKGNLYYEDKNGNIKHSKSLIVKTTKNDKLNQSKDQSAFVNELLMYNKILPFFYNMNHSLTNLFPKFYYGAITSDDPLKGIEILENLQEDGYRMANSRTILDIPHLLLMVKKLGELHAYSYQAKKQQSEKFFEIIKNFKETSAMLNQDQQFLVPIHEYFLEHLSAFENYRDDVEVIRTIIKKPKNFIEKIFSTKNEPTAVICHGDFLRNNVLFKYDFYNNPIDIKFIDLGNARYCSPVTDLGLVLYMHSDQDTRNRYWDQLIDSYYDTLKNTFPENDLVPTKNDILKEFKVTILQPYLIVMIWLPMMMAMEEHHMAPDWFTRYFSPEHEEYKCSKVRMPFYVAQKAVLNLINSSKRSKILDVLIDIINRDFV